jgi:hypothetical protein
MRAGLLAALPAGGWLFRGAMLPTRWLQDTPLPRASQAPPSQVPPLHTRGHYVCTRRAEVVPLQ